MKNLIIVTSSYPIGEETEKAFLEVEMEYLVKYFDRVVLVPQTEIAPQCSLPAGVEVSRCLVDANASRHKWMKLARFPFTPISWLTDHPKYAIACSWIEKQLREYMKANGMDAGNTLVYFFWLEYTAPSIALLRRNMGVRYVARAHSFDTMLPASRRMRKDLVDGSEGIWGISDNAVSNLTAQFGHEKIRKAYLGTDIPEGLVPRESVPGEVRFLSVSRITKGKRVARNVEYVNALASAFPDVKFTLTYIGGSKSQVRDLMKELDEKNIGPDSVNRNFTYSLLGEKDHGEVLRMMSEEYYDWYLLLSESEGIAVAMMEAMAHGIPAVVTNVGGNSEVLVPGCGELLDVNAPSSEFVAVMSPYIKDSRKRDACSRECVERMRANFDSRKLREQWARELSELI